MFTKRFIVATFSAGMLALGTSQATGQDYPSKPIRVVANGIGGNSDILVRLITPALTENLGQQVIVDPRPGGVIPGEVVSKAPPDGYTLLITGSNLWLGTLLQSTPYDPVKDFSPISVAFSAPNVLVVHPSLPVKSVKELIALAKAKPGELNYAAAATGSSSHLAGALFTYMANINIVHIPYRGGTTQMADLLGGHVQVSFATAGSSAPHIKSGRLRALAVTSAQPSALFPGLPTVAAGGVPGYESVAVTGMFAPGQTPPAIIHRLNQEVVRVLNKAEVKERVASSGVDTIGSSPEELAARIKSELALWSKVIKAGGIKMD